MHAAEQYIADVLSGKQIVGIHVRRAVERHVNDLERSESDPDYPFYFSKKKALRRLRFNSFCLHSKGKWAGTPFVAEPWQAFIAWCGYGWLRKEDDCRRFTVWYIQVARKNGKTFMGATDGVYMLDGDGENGADCFTVATKRDQALLSHNEATRMIKKSPALAKRIEIHKHSLSVEATESTFTPLGSNEDSMDGLSVHFALCDELHAWKKALLWEVITTATGARDNPIIMAITTPGFDHATICHDNYDYAKRIIDPDSPVEDDEWFAFIAEVDDDDDPFDESCWIKGNPNLGVSVSMRDMRREAKRAKAQPSRLNAFRRLKLGQWTESEEQWLPMNRWTACQSAVDEDELAGKDCYAGLDLATVRDMNAFSLVFPADQTKSGRREQIIRYWVPEGSLLEQQKRTSSYSGWIDEGWITVTPGDVANYNQIQADIEALCERYHVIEIAFDPYNSTQIVQNLIDAGLNMVLFRQGYLTMSPACKEFERSILTGEINPGLSPVLKWNGECAVIKRDPSDNIKIDRDASTRYGKVDGLVAMIMAHHRAVLHETAEPEPVPRVRVI